MSEPIGTSTLLGDPLSLEAAHAAIRAALDYARRNRLRVSIAVVDAGGYLIAFARIPGTPLHSIDITQDKAMTAVSFGMPTSTVGELINNATDAVRMSLMLRPRMVPLGGAFPLMIGERLVGAIGVSGASEEQDIECAIAGCRAIGAQ